MGITIDRLVEQHPRLYHMAEAGSWPSIARHGLLSTTALLDLYEVTGDARSAILSRRRPESVTIHHPVHGSAVVRDQKPISDAALARCLVGCGASQWYELANNRVYFWLTEKKLQDLLNARAYRGAQRTLLVLDSRMLLEQYESKVLLSAINSGSTLRAAVPRGLTTFRSLASYPYAERRRARGAQDAIAELTIEYAVPDVARFVTRVERRQGAEVLEVIR